MEYLATEVGFIIPICEPRGAMSCGSPMPRGGRIAKPHGFRKTWILAPDGPGDACPRTVPRARRGAAHTLLGLLLLRPLRAARNVSQL